MAVYKCSVIECENKCDTYYCKEHTDWLSKHRTFKIILCKTCNNAIRFEESDKIEVVMEPTCKSCEEFGY